MKDTALAMAKRLIIDSIWKSANLEGLGTTYQKTEAIIRNAPTITTANEVLFVINMKCAWQFLFDNLEYSNSLSILREFNKIVGYMMFYGNGDIRTLPVSISGTSWEPSQPQEGIILSTINELNEIKDPELKALKYFCFITRTQMFIDGNKRVAQLMTNKILIENDIGIFQINIADLEDFKTLLVQFYKSGNDTKIIEFMKKKCVKHVAEEYANLK